MERLIQYLDDLDDLCGMAGLVLERLRRLSYALFSGLLIVVGAVAVIITGTSNVIHRSYDRRPSYFAYRK